VTPFNLYLARLLENSEMASGEHRERFGIETRLVMISSFHREGQDGHVAELEEVVVGTRALPIADWRRAFKLGFFLAACHNLRLLDVFLQVGLRAGLDLRAILERLLQSEGPALARIDATLERYAEAILRGQAMVLPAAETGDHLWAPEDAVLIAALAAPEPFFAEVEAAAPNPLMAEAARYQRFITPAPGQRSPTPRPLQLRFPRRRRSPRDGAGVDAVDAPGSRARSQELCARLPRLRPLARAHGDHRPRVATMRRCMLAHRRNMRPRRCSGGHLKVLMTRTSPLLVTVVRF